MKCKGVEKTEQGRRKKKMPTAASSSTGIGRLDWKGLGATVSLETSNLHEGRSFWGFSWMKSASTLATALRPFGTSVRAGA